MAPKTVLFGFNCDENHVLVYAEPQDIEIEGMVVTNLMFTSSGNLTKCINIFIIDDEIAEEFEMFAISLSTLSSDVIITTPAMSILIMDNDGKE